MIDTILGFLWGFLISGFLIVLAFSQSDAIQTIMNAEGGQRESRFVVLCQAKDSERVRCAPQIEEQAP